VILPGARVVAKGTIRHSVIGGRAIAEGDIESQILYGD
jgi:hypothetical protein